ncbi:MAG: homoserine O-acetyltransferase [Pseudomonadales bacterium]|nr:homoserine O-acetyltransferase [Pseudomonadales bacterium]MDP6473175.1 homoserine O-acetyltransferase [Pseudomonadales bacterium]MDP6971403.1 homoserine O-acetyltransferase [Pseudomonadales bacterium]
MRLRYIEFLDENGVRVFDLNALYCLAHAGSPVMILAKLRVETRCYHMPNACMHALKKHILNGSFDMRRGRLQSPTFAYETWGRLNRDRDNAVLLFTGLSPSAHAASSPDDPSTGWWEDVIGPGKPIDTNRFYVICVNSLGSCFGSTGPSSIDPITARPYRLTFPVLTVEDIANGGAHILDNLGIDTLFAVAGASMGGMTALAFALQFPGRYQGFVSISSAARSLPFSIALRSLQREMIRNDPAWLNGEYDVEHGPVSGMRLARKLGMISYRSAWEWEARFGRERATIDVQDEDNPFGIDFEVEAYLEAHANKFIGSFDPNCYLYLSRAMDLFDASDWGGSTGAAMQRITAERVLIIGVESDFLFPLQQQQELAVALRSCISDVDFQRLPSLQGHDSFLVDMDRFRPAIARFF